MGVFCSQVGQMGVELVWSENGGKRKKTRVLRMKFSIVEIVPTPDDSVFELSPASQPPYNGKIQKNELE